MLLIQMDVEYAFILLVYTLLRNHRRTHGRRRYRRLPNLNGLWQSTVQLFYVAYVQINNMPGHASISD